jgi:predicted ATP-dependent serine protease
VPQADARLKEAARLGFKTAFVPAGTKAEVPGLALTEITSVVDLLRFAPEPQPRRAKVGQ